MIIGNAGKPVAVLSAYDQDPEPRKFGGWAGTAWISEDFDAPLPADLQAYFDGDVEDDWCEPAPGHSRTAVVDRC